MTSIANLFEVAVFPLSRLVTCPGFMSISLLILEISTLEPDEMEFSVGELFGYRYINLDRLIVLKDWIS